MKVKKEITVAIIIGLLIGGIVVGGILRARRAITNLTQSPINSPSPAPSGVEVTDTGLFLKLDTPDNQVFEEPSITITGKTLPKTYIVINAEAGDTIIVPNDIGNFSQDVKLVKGANTIKVTVYQEDGAKQESTLNAVYTTTGI